MLNPRSAAPILVVEDSDDLNLMSSDGCEILAELKGGANSYVLKPMDTDEFLHEVNMLTRSWFDVVMLPSSVPE